MNTRLIALLLLLCTVSAAATAQASPPPNLVLHGEVHPTQKQTYIEAPFSVPIGTHRITVSFHNLGKDQHTVIDLGILDPVRFRGASGGNKQEFTLSETDATPSYLPGAIPSGLWKLLLAIPNIRPDVTSQWRAEVWFDRALDDSSFAEQPLHNQPAWYRGDLHMHTAHSDGSCASQTGQSVPCPLFVTVEAAARRGLDFIAITDHNTTSQYGEERELQPYFNKILLIPGRELTTFYGHANILGSMRFMDYRVGTPQVPEMDTLFRRAHDLGAIVSINHPEAPTGEICMGCGWTPTKSADMHLAIAIEVVNGGGPPATHFWEEQLGQGYRLTALGGSDNHRADWPLEHPGSVGYPTTVVHAQSLSVAAILDGIRSGHVFIDLTGSRDRLLEMHARDGSASADMGDRLDTRNGDMVSLQAHVVACGNGKVSFFFDGQPSPMIPPVPVSSADQTVTAHWHADGGRHWIRAEVHDAQGNLLLLGNPVYINFAVDPQR